MSRSASAIPTTRSTHRWVTVRANEAAASDAEVVVLCTPWQGTQEAVQGCGDLSGKILIDATNPLSPVRRGFGTDFGFGLLRGRA